MHKYYMSRKVLTNNVILGTVRDTFGKHGLGRGSNKGSGSGSTNYHTLRSLSIPSSFHEKAISRHSFYQSIISLHPRSFKPLLPQGRSFLSTFGPITTISTTLRSCTLTSELTLSRKVQASRAFFLLSQWATGLATIEYYAESMREVSSKLASSGRTSVKWEKCHIIGA